MKNNRANAAWISAVLLVLGLACSSSDLHSTHPKSASYRTEGTKKLESYTIKGIKFVYFKIPRNLNSSDLIATAQSLHELEPDAHLLLVDDDEMLDEYISYAKSISGATPSNVEIPREWADKHIIANVQRYGNGKVLLCEGNGYREIAELR